MTEQSLLNRCITFHPQTGTLSITFPGQETTSSEAWTPIHNGTASVDYRLDGTSRRLVLSGPDVSFGIGERLVTFSHHDDHLHLDWGWTRVKDALEGWLEVTNRGDSHLTVDRLNVLRLTQAGSLDLPGSVADWRIYLNGWQSRTPPPRVL